MKGTKIKTIMLIRHGETEWTKTGQHTGITDLPLTEKGREEARAIGRRLEGISFNYAWTSPSLRARETSELAGFKALITPDLAEWDYGDYEGKTSQEIWKSNPGWTIFSEDPPHGETAVEVERRADRFWKELLTHEGDVAIFSSGHISRVLAVRFLGLPLAYGRYFTLSTASISLFGFEHNLPVIKLWNDISHYEQRWKAK